jgi:hypothetical protein
MQGCQPVAGRGWTLETDCMDQQFVVLSPSFVMVVSCFARVPKVAHVISIHGALMSSHQPRAVLPVPQERWWQG